MTFGTGLFGTSPWGGTGLDGTGPYIVTSDPLPAATGIAVDTSVSITFNADTGIDKNTLDISLGGSQAIVGGSFTPGYGGTVVDDGSQVSVTISTHPDFVGGLPLTVDVSVRDLSDNLGTFSYSFYVGFAVINAAENVSFSEAAASVYNAIQAAPEVAAIGEALSNQVSFLAKATETAPISITLEVPENNLFVDESVSVSDAVTTFLGYVATLSETVPVTEDSIIRSFTATALSGTQIRLDFALDVLIPGAVNPASYSIHPASSGYPTSVLVVTPFWDTLRSGAQAQLVVGDGFWSDTVELLDGTFDTADVGRYLQLDGVDYLILSVMGSQCTIDRRLPIVPNDMMPWAVHTAVQGVLLDVAKTTNGASYQINTYNLVTPDGIHVPGTTFMVAVAAKPRVVEAVADASGGIIVAFDSAMRTDGALTDPGQYTIPGVRILDVGTVDSTHVVLRTLGMTDTGFTLTVNASGTPKDEAGNPLDPGFNQAIFTGYTPTNEKSVFTDHGPLTKPPDDVQAGVDSALVNETDVELTGATVLPSHVGLYLVLTGASTNAGSFRISARLSSTRVRVKASFTLPDATSFMWTIQDPRDGQIADDPADVTVRINSIQVTPDAVIGLLGQVVLPNVPDTADDVQIDYHWCLNPTVEARRLNSKEFRLNGWNRNLGAHSDTQHEYRYNTILVTPTEYVPDDMQALLDQPRLWDMHYRAYERAYTAVLNDPTLLTLNAPLHRVAYAPMSRETLSEFIRYEATTLPENDSTAPWTRHGSGTATAIGGVLTVVDDSSGQYPTGQPIFWTRDIDLSFPAAFALSWRGQVTAATDPDGVFIGVAAGHGDGDRVALVGLLLVGGVRKIGLLRHGGGNDPALLDSWAGGLDINGNPTGLPVDFDWSILHSYRTYRDPDGTVKVYVDGSVVEALRLTRDDLPFLEELDDPFDSLQGVFFGAPSRPARSMSTWDFVRYLVLPLNPYQVAPTSFCNYEGDVLPEDAAKPWTPVGHHGTETLLANDMLLLDSTSASGDSSVGLATGDFRGFVRMEPLLPAASEVLLDVQLQGLTSTHGVTPNAVMAAVDDGNRLLQLCYLNDVASPKASYGGRSLPTDLPWNWQGIIQVPATAQMAGQLLRITDSTATGGVVFYTEDLAPVGDPARIVSGTTDWVLEFRCAVLSYTPEVAPDPAFAGVQGQVYDGTRLVGLMTCTVAGVPMLAWHSDGTVLATVPFNWDDQEQHTFRVIKNTAGNLVTLVIDGVYIGSLAYSTFQVPAIPDPIGIISFGSSTPASTGASSTVDWTYANAWRTLSPRRYVGVWKGHDNNSLIGYHLPLKVSGTAATVAGNALGDTTASFLSAGVAIGDLLVIDSGPNKGTYEVAGVSGPTTLTIMGTFPVAPSTVSYRIPTQTDWTTSHRYRMIRTPLGDISVILDDVVQPLITLEYSYNDLPSRSSGLVHVLSSGQPAIAWGALDPDNLSEVAWDHVRYGISRSPTELRIAPHHQNLYQWNVIASAEHLRTLIAHSHTGYLSCSTGIPPNTNPDLFDSTALAAYTQLNDDTPLVPQTQSWEVRRPTPVEVPIAGLNRIEDVLNTDPDFVLNDSLTRIELVVPDDVLYTSLQVIEQATGEAGLLKPFDDWMRDLGEIKYVNEVCLSYDGTVLPENDSSAPTPWQRVSDDPSQVSASVAAGILTYGTGSIGTRTVYRNNTPLTDAPGLEVEASYRLRVAQDTTFGMGDTLMRVGLSGLGYTVGLAFVTSSVGRRLVLVYDLADGKILGSVVFDYLDGNYHTYKIIRDIKHSSVRIEVVA